MLSLLWHEILSRRNAIIGWGIGLILFALMYTSIYPEMEDQLAGLGDLSVYQAMGIEVATFEGYLGTSVIGFIPILLGIYAIMTSTASLAGEEDDGTLEILISTRLPRWQLVVAKGLGLLIVTAVIVIIAGLGQIFALSLVVDQIDTAVTGGDVFSIVLSALPLIWALLMIGLFFGTFFPNRRLAMMMGFLVLIVSYFGENLGGMLEELEVIRPFSLFTYFDSSSVAFADGVDLGNIAVLLLISIIAFGLAIVSFNRRDVTVGNWPWQRVRVGKQKPVTRSQ